MPQISVAELEEEVARLRRELAEASERQSATDEVLRIIASSPADAQRVFDAIVRNFVSLCSSTFGAIYTFDGELVHFAGAHGFSPEQLNELKAKYPVHADDRSVLSARAIRAKAPVHIQDVMADPHYDRHHAVLMRSRRMLAMPMLREGVALGAIVAAWPDAGATPKAHEDLFKVFAAQAVIAIENTRLLNELRESLQQQTATADVLKVISRSTFDLQTVLDTLVESATRLCGADHALLFRRDGETCYLAANYGRSHQFEEYFKQHPIAIDRGSLTGRTVLEGKVIHIPDAQSDPEYTMTELIKLDPFRTMLGVPLLREGSPIGVITLTRAMMRPFTKQEIQLVTTFADQAVIAIENVRLFDEVQARTRDLSEALEQQTATADVLRLISTSPGELQPVFSAMLENALQICEAKFGLLYRYSDDAFVARAMVGAPPALVDALLDKPFVPGPAVPLGRLLRTKQVIRTIDAGAEESKPLSAQLADARSHIAVPMLKDNELIGAICIYRQEVRPFTDKQVELVSNFAQQAVIAIENTRLLNELRESLQQQTATADVLKVISSSPEDLQPVFELHVGERNAVVSGQIGQSVSS